MTTKPPRGEPAPLSACLDIDRTLRQGPAVTMNAPLPRRPNGAQRQSQMMRRALAAIGAINPWTDFVLGPSYGRDLPPLPEDRRRA